MPNRSSLLLLLLSLISSSHSCNALSTPAEALSVTKSRLSESLKSLSGKLTLSPEINILEPTDPTALLLQSTEITALSEEMRTAAKANAVVLSGTVESITNFCDEQETQRGNFPGPLPIIAVCDGNDDWEHLRDAGVCAVLIECNANELEQVTEKCEAARALGLQPIPEVLIQESDYENHWKNDDDENCYMEGIITKLTEHMGGQEPASVLVSIQTEADDMEEAPEEPVPLPSVPKSLTKQIPILGSISVMAGGNRMGSETKRFKAAGYSGAVLRSGCLPEAFTSDLPLLSRFWSSCIAQLKSTKSTQFEFRTRNYLEKSEPVEWAKYQKSVLDSGALGGGEHESINSDGGDYNAF